MEFETEEQELEALKKWWKANAKLIIAGIVISVVLVIGWRFYQQYQLNHSEKASILYEDVLHGAETAADINTLQTQVNTLMAEYANTPYAALSVLVLAGQQVKAGDNIKAAQQLEWVIKNSSAVEISTIARLRLARIMQATEQLDAAMNLVNTEYPESFTALFEELKGDLYVVRGDTANARIAYDKAIQASESGASDFLKIKRNDLGNIALSKPAL